MQNQDPAPVSVSSRLAEEGASPQVVREVRAVEKLANARVITVTANGQFPFWTLERWMAVLTFIFGVGGGIVFATTSWVEMKGNVAKLTNQIEALGNALDLERQESVKRFDALRAQLDNEQHQQQQRRR